MGINGGAEEPVELGGERFRAEENDVGGSQSWCSAGPEVLDLGRIGAGPFGADEALGGLQGPAIEGQS